MLLIVPPTTTPTSPLPINGPSAVSPDIRLVGGEVHTPWYCWTMFRAWPPIVVLAALPTSAGGCICARAANVCIEERALMTNRQPSTKTLLILCRPWLEVIIENLLVDEHHCLSFSSKMGRYLFTRRYSCYLLSLFLQLFFPTRGPLGSLPVGGPTSREGQDPTTQGGRRSVYCDTSVIFVSRGFCKCWGGVAPRGGRLSPS